MPKPPALPMHTLVLDDDQANFIAACFCYCAAIFSPLKHPGEIAKATITVNNAAAQLDQAQAEDIMNKMWAIAKTPAVPRR